jgi:alkylation response protein AidB-like acyl-CoA dehydrogenase
MIDFEPSEEQQLIVDTVRQFAANELRKAAREADEAREIPAAALARAHELALVSSALPEAYGGGGARSAVTGALAAEELAYGDLGMALAVLSPTLLALPIADFGSEAQKKEWLPRFAGDRYLPGSLGLVEPAFRFDPLHPATTAKRDGRDYVLDGAKCFVPWQEGLEAVLVTAQEDGVAQGFLVPRDAPGLSATREKNLGIRALPTAELALRGVRVPRSAKLGGEGERGDAALRQILNRGRVALAACAVGVARAAFEIARDYAKERQTFGAPIATRQAIAFKLADMAIEIDGARLLTWEAAWTIDEGRDATREATIARHQAQRVALEVADGAVQVLGGHGYIREYLPEMQLRNARGFCTFEALCLV